MDISDQLFERFQAERKSPDYHSTYDHEPLLRHYKQKNQQVL